MENKFAKLNSFITKNWNSVIALIAIFGVLVFNFIPDAEKYNSFFIFVGANAIIWTLIEIKQKLNKTDKEVSKRYANMREARSSIIKSIERQMSKKHDKVLEILIVGGRIRTISDMIREIKNDIQTNKINASNIKFSIYTIHPEIIKDWCFKDGDEELLEEVKKRNLMYSNLITHFKNELEDYNSNKIFTDNKITIEVNYYKGFPYFYAYIIDKELYWGFFTYDDIKDDFIGPENTCFHLTQKDEYYSDYYNWIMNRVNFLKITNKFGNNAK